MKPKHHPSLDRWLVLGWSVTAPPLKRFPLDPFNEGNFWGGSGLQKKRHQYGWMFCFALPPWKLTYPHKFDGWKMICPFKMVPFQGTLVDFQGVITSKRGFKSDDWNIVSTWGCWFFIYQRKPSQKSSKKTHELGAQNPPREIPEKCCLVVLPWPSHITSGPIIILQFWDMLEPISLAPSIG